MEDYKQKYEQALDNFKKIKAANKDNKELVDFIEYKYPELKESEDKRIMKMLIERMKRWHECALENNVVQDIKDSRDAIAWLEKQGEQKEINLVEILKHYPKETELYSPLYGKLWLAEVDEEHEIITCYKHPLSEGDVRAISEQEDTVSFYSNGTTGLPDFSISKDCMLFLYDSEKQGEQKPADKVNPKFKIGDWVQIDGGHVMKILDVKKDVLCYRILNWYGNESVRNISDIDSIAHLWTILDAKEGDILQANKCTLIFDSLTNDIDGDTVISSWYYCDTKTFYGMGTCDPDLWAIEGVTPATQEQCDLLFAKMKEAGYEWDAEKKELKKIEQKPAWSEEDEEYLQNIVEWVEYLIDDEDCGDMTYDEHKEFYMKRISWLKSLKERMKG